MSLLYIVHCPNIGFNQSCLTLKPLQVPFHSQQSTSSVSQRLHSPGKYNNVKIKVYSMQSICTLTSFKVSGDESAAPCHSPPWCSDLCQPAPAAGALSASFVFNLIHCRHPLYSRREYQTARSKKNNSESESKGHYVFNPVHLVCSHSISPNPHLNLIDNI